MVLGAGRPATRRKLESLVRFELLDADGKRWLPRALEQFAIDFDRLQHDQLGAINIGTRMHFAHNQQPLTVPLRMHLEPLPAIAGSDVSGVRLLIEFTPSKEMELEVQAANESLRWTDKAGMPSLVIDDHSAIECTASHNGLVKLTTSGVRVASSAVGQPIRFELTLKTSWPVDQFIEPTSNNANTPASAASNAPSPAEATLQAVNINLVPGFDGIRLPLRGPRCLRH